MLDGLEVTGRTVSCLHQVSIMFEVSELSPFCQFTQSAGVNVEELQSDGTRPTYCANCVNSDLLSYKQ